MTLHTQRFFLLAPDGPAFPRLAEAEQYFLSGNLNEALAAAQQAWREHPREPDVFRVLAYLHMARGEYPPAEQAARQALLLDEGNPLSHAMLAQVYLTFDIRQSADALLTRAVARFPGELSLVALLADLSFRQRQYLRAVEMANRVLAVNPQDGYMHALLGQYYLRRRNFAQAAGHLAGAVHAYPQRADYQRDLGITLLHVADYPAAARALADSLALLPTDRATQHYLCYALKLLPAPSWYWRLSCLFYEFPAPGWLLAVIGWSGILVGPIWLLIAAVAADCDFWSIIIPAAISAVSAALLVMTTSGLTMKTRSGDRFEAALHRMMEQHGLTTTPHL